MKTILLTGATGFLGSHLLEALISHDYEVIVLKRRGSDVWRVSHLLDKVKVYDIDVDTIESVFSDNSVDVIIHLATLYRKFDNGMEVKEMIDANISFPVELLETGVRYGIKGFVNTGTFFEYDCSKLPVTEDAITKPFNLYAKTKLAFESVLETYSDQLMINTFRLFSPYGEKDNDKLIPMIIKKALSNDSVVLSDGLQKMDFIYASDIVDAYIKAILNMQDQSQKNGYQLFNLGSGMPISVREVVSIVEQQLGITINKTWGAPSIVDMPVVFADITRVVTELDWAPKHSIHEGIEKTIAYYKDRVDK